MLFFLFRNIKKAEDKVASLEKETEENDAKINELEVI